jgi:hypothetical protein
MAGPILYKEKPWKFRSTRTISLIPTFFGSLFMSALLIMGISRGSRGVIIPSVGLLIIVPLSIYGFWAQRGFYVDQEGIQFPKPWKRYILFKDIETIEINNVRAGPKEKGYRICESYIEFTMKNMEIIKISKGYSLRNYGTYDFKKIKEIVYRQWRYVNKKGKK